MNDQAIEIYAGKVEELKVAKGEEYSVILTATIDDSYFTFAGERKISLYLRKDQAKMLAVVLGHWDEKHIL